MARLANHVRRVLAVALVAGWAVMAAAAVDERNNTAATTRRALTSQHLLPHVPLLEMEPMKINGETMRPIDMDGRTTRGTTWINAFEELIKSRLATNPAPTKTDEQNRGRQKRYFDKYFCIGMMKSGTTSVHRAFASFLGVKTQGRWIEPFVDAIQEGTLEWFQDANQWPQYYPQIQKRIDASQAFEDAPWPFLYRIYPNMTPGQRISYVFTIRDCRKHAESSAAYCNQRKGRTNSEYWISDHCARTYRRCHVHQADVYHYFAHERPQDQPLNDLLVIEMTGEKGKDNWDRFRNFFHGGGQAAYMSPSLKTRAPTDNGRGKDDLNLNGIDTFPRSNSKATWQKNYKFCKPEDFAPWENQPLAGNLLYDASPVLMSRFCVLPELQHNAKQMRRCRKKKADLEAWFEAHNQTLPKGAVPNEWLKWERLHPE